MAAVTLLGSVTSSSTSGSKTVNAIPAVGDLYVIVCAHSGNTASVAPADNIEDGLGSYTLLASAVKNGSTDTLSLWVRDALVASVSGALRAFTHNPGTTTGGIVAVLKITGMTFAGSAALRQSAKEENQAGATQPDPVFASAPLSTNPIIGALFNAANPAGVTPRTNFTERADDGYNTPTSGIEIMTRDSGETATTQTWGSTSAAAFCAIVVELDASAGSSPQGLTQSSRFDNSNTFYAHSVSATKQLTPAQFVNSSTFRAHTVAPGAIALTVTEKYDSFNIFRVHTVDRGPVNLAPAHFSPGNTFRAHSIQTTYALAAGYFVTTNSFGAAVVSQADVAVVAPAHFINSNTFRAHTIIADQPLVQSARFNASNSFGVAVVSAGPVTANPSRFENVNTFRTHVLTASNALLPPFIPSSNTFHSATITTSYALLASHFLNSGGFYTHSLLTSNNISPVFFQNTPVFYPAAVEFSFSLTAANTFPVNQTWPEKAYPLVFQPRVII